MELLHAFELHLRGKGLAKRTVYTYTATIHRFIRWVEERYEEFDIAAITPLDIADYRRQLTKEGKKPAMVNHALDVLSGFFSWASREGMTQADPTYGIKKVKEQKSAPRWLERREIGALIRVIQKYGTFRDMALIVLLLHAGLRISEAVSLRPEDLVIRERSGSVRIREGKGGKYREVPLNITARRALNNYLCTHSNVWLFPGKRGHHLTTTAEKILAKFGRLADIRVSPHQLRHSFGKLLIDGGESLDRVTVLMGHSNLNTTAKYTRPSIQDLERAVEKLTWSKCVK